MAEKGNRFRGMADMFGAQWWYFRHYSVEKRLKTQEMCHFSRGLEH
jgi:hypothetical protein